MGVKKGELKGLAEKESGFCFSNGTILLPLGLKGPFDVLLEMYQYMDARSGLQSQPERGKYKILPHLPLALLL